MCQNTEGDILRLDVDPGWQEFVLKDLHKNGKAVLSSQVYRKRCFRVILDTGAEEIVIGSETIPYYLVNPELLGNSWREIKFIMEDAPMNFNTAGDGRSSTQVVRIPLILRHPDDDQHTIPEVVWVAARVIPGCCPLFAWIHSIPWLCQVSPCNGLPHGQENMCLSIQAKG